MKESLIDIFERVWPSYWEFISNEPTDREHYLTAKRERIKAVSEYASSLKTLGDDWIEAVNNDVKSLAAPIHYPQSISFSKDKRLTYRLCVQDFLIDVREAIITHGRTERQLTELLKPITCYLLNIEISNMVVKERLSKDEAYNECKQMKQQGFSYTCFPTEIFPAQYVLFAYKPKSTTTQPEQASTPMPFPTTLDNNEFKAILARAINNRIVEDKGEGHYKWNDTLYLLAYFAIRVTKVLKLPVKRYHAAASWNTFETLFDIKKGTLRGKSSDWAKTGLNIHEEDFRPTGWEKIESLLNENVK